MTDENKRRRRGGIQRGGAIRSALSPFFCVSFVFPVEFLIYRIVTTESEGSGTDRDSRTEVNRYNSDFLLIFGEGMRDKGNNVKNANLSHEDNDRKTMQKESKEREGTMGRRTGGDLFFPGVNFAIT